jgi:hypothetical protein
MTNGKKKAPQHPAKQPYRAPKLRIHGDLQTLTQSKAGCMADGSSKPATRVGAGGGA